MNARRRQPPSLDPLLAELARLYGVQARYRDSRGVWRESPKHSVIEVLTALGAALPGDSGAAGIPAAVLRGAIRTRELELWRRVIEPVVLAWDGALPTVTVRLPMGLTGRGSRGVGSTGKRPAGHAPLGARVTLITEGGASGSWDVSLSDADEVAVATVGRERFEARKLRLTGSGRPRWVPGRLPVGYHRLRLEIGQTQVETAMISAPRRCWPAGSAGDDATAGEPMARSRKTSKAARDWGLFAPLYALRSDRDWGAGDIADLAALAAWVGEAGGSVVATLPLLASYLDEPFEPAPYRPVSRLFWNEFYLAVDRIEEWDRCETARHLWTSAESRRELARLRAAPLVDYKGVMALKQRVLRELAHCFFASAHGGRKEAFYAFLSAYPEVRRYALFRAGKEAGDEDAGPLSEESRLQAGEPERYHLYCQWQMEEQISRLSGLADAGAETGSAGAPGNPATRLLLDLPLGVHPGGYDTWRWPDLFACGMSAGAPPDSFFSAGQRWDFPPLLPDRIRKQGHEYFAACLRHSMRHGRYLRVDHIMGLHRLFWVPQDAEAAAGVYVNYPAEELYAVLCLESQRHRSTVIGEDLGTVPVGVRAAMRRHGLLRTWVLQASLRSGRRRATSRSPFGEIPRGTVASLNTHDMFPFAGFVGGDDIRARMETGQLDPAAVPSELAARGQAVARLAAFLRETPGGVAGTLARPPLHGVEAPEQGAAESAACGIAELFDKVIACLAGSQTDLLLVNLEDLLLATKPQNVPGTGVEWNNWRRKLSASEARSRWAIAAVMQLLVARTDPS